MKQLQLTIYVNETDMVGELPLHEVIVRRLHHFDIAGATVTRGLMGYGQHGKVHRKRLFGVSDDRPVVITAVDDASRLRPILQDLRSVVTEGLMTTCEVEVI